MMSQQLYIPEISDTIRLAADWTFQLYHERRNYDLFNIFWPNGCKPLEKLQEKMQKKSQELSQKAHEFWVKHSKTLYKGGHRYCQIQDPVKKAEYDRMERESIQACKHVRNYAEPHTLPKGAELKVDRVYIRKGASDFSSITFWLVSAPDDSFGPRNKNGTLKKKIRFWAKLADCNQIMFEKP